MDLATSPPKPRPGDRVAIVSPSSGLPGLLPMPFELGLERIRSLGLVPVEYPTTRRMGSTPQDRVADLHHAFGDPEIKAVIASIGGSDQITLLKHLDAELIKANPKPFFGFSDNTVLLTFLSNLGITSYHGGSVMCEFGRPGAMHPVTEAALRAALFTTEAYDLQDNVEIRDIDVPWDDPRTFEKAPPMEPYDGWVWKQHTDRIVEGRLWGGSLEILSWLAMADREIRPAETYEGAILALETSEELPTAVEVSRILRNFGERGLLAASAGIVVGRPKSWSLDQRNTDEQRREYVEAQHRAVVDAVAAYAPDALLVLDVCFGHTDPQQTLPIGGRMRIDGPARRITVLY